MSAGVLRPVDRPVLEGLHACAWHAGHVGLSAGGRPQNLLDDVAVQVSLVGGGVVFSTDRVGEDLSVSRIMDKPGQNHTFFEVFQLEPGGAELPSGRRDGDFP